MEEEYYQKLSANDILVRLARYPMEERLCSFMKDSSEFVKNGYSTDKALNENKLQPWEMETFLLFCILANNKVTKKHLQSKEGIREKYNILLNIRNGLEPWEKDSYQASLDRILLAIANQQFPIQHYHIWMNSYRFSFLFNFNSCFESLFLQKFHVPYDEILAGLFVIDCLIRTNKFTQDLLQKFVKQNPYLLNVFVKDLDTLITEQKLLIGNHTCYKYVFKLFTAYPFVKYEDNYYLCLPHTLLPASTDSLLMRLTDGNDEVRKAFGDAFEEYVFKIVKDSGLYANVSPEQKYFKNKQEIKSPDIMLLSDDSMVFVEVKLTQTNVGIKNLDDKKIEEAINQRADNIVQLYKRIKDYPKYLNPFGVIQEMTNVFGVVVYLQDANIFRDNIYNKVFSKLKLAPNSEEANFIKSNISICDVVDFEDLYFSGKCIIPHLKNRRDNGLCNNFSIINREIYDKQPDKKSEKLEKFKEKMKALMLSKLSSLYDKNDKK